VHGLGANPSTTWTRSGKCWITDFLPEGMKERKCQSSVRLFTFSYKSHWLRSSNLRLRETAKALLQELSRPEVRASTQHGPPS
jgi:hypothetical protein